MARKQASKAPEEVQSVAAYMRVSTYEQKVSGLGLDAQRTKCLAMAEVKDWPEPVLYVEDAISGTKETSDRPKLLALREALKAGKHQAVIVASLDRLSRKSRLTLELTDEMKQYGVFFVSCREAFDTTTPAGYLFMSICAAMAQYERDLLSQRTIAALAELDKKTGEHGGRIPYGYVRIPSSVRIDHQQARVVRLIFAMRQRDEETLREIAKKLNQSHIPASRGGQWRHTSVKEILSHEETYRGGQRGKSQFKWPVILKEVA